MKQILLTLFGIVHFIGPLHAQEWHTDFAEAKAIAAKEKKTILLVFQGSDWCAPCIKLDREIWSADDFKAYASDHYVLLKADFPRKKKNQLPQEQQKANAQLAEKYNQQGIFPLVIVLDSSGKVLGKTSYKKLSPPDYITHLQSLKP